MLMYYEFSIAWENCDKKSCRKKTANSASSAAGLSSNDAHILEALCPIPKLKHHNSFTLHQALSNQAMSTYPEPKTSNLSQSQESFRYVFLIRNMQEDPLVLPIPMLLLLIQPDIPAPCLRSPAPCLFSSSTRAAVPPMTAATTCALPRVYASPPVHEARKLVMRDVEFKASAL